VNTRSQETRKSPDLTDADIARLAAALRQPCAIVKQARDVNHRAVMWQRWGYYSKSEPLFARAHSLMRAARCRRDFLRAQVAP
jgi:hypothetical protein